MDRARPDRADAVYHRSHTRFHAAATLRSDACHDCLVPVMKRDAKTPEDYVAAVPEPQRALLKAVRSVIFRAVPDVAEEIRYGMLDYPGLANLAAQKAYVALYVKASVLAAFKPRFPGVSCGKSCLRIVRPEQVDEDALQEMLVAVRQARLEDGSA